MLNRELEVTLNLAFKEARSKRHEFMTVEHLLLALLDNEAAATVLRACGANLDKLKHDLQEFIDSTTPLIPVHDEDRETQPTLGFQRVLQRAVFHVQSSGKREVTGANVLVAIFSEQESQAVFLLKQQSVARIDVVNYIAHGISKVPGHGDQSEGEQDMQDDEGGESSSSGNPLDAYASNLNELARQGRIDPLVGREMEVERVAQILARRRWWARRGWARPPSPKVWPNVSSIIKCRTCSPTVSFIPSTWVRCWPGPNTAGISKSASKRCWAN
jgi:ATP-dependent Clp protease ATP-binding subunit ClpA